MFNIRVLFIIIAAIITLIIILLIILTVIMLAGAKDNGEKVCEDIPVIVPGCRICGEKPSLALKSRLDCAYQYLVSHQKAMCIVCGGQFGKISEAEVMKNYLINKGISADRILEDRISKTTFENMREARKLLINAKVKSREVFVATNTYHLYRCLRLAKDFYFLPHGLRAVTPKSVLIYSWLREYCALTKYFLKS